MSWPPDLRSHVTRTTSGRTAYDPNTPTLFPQTRDAIGAQKTVYYPIKLLTPVNPSQNSQAAATPRNLRQEPREAQPGARDESAPTIFDGNGPTERGSANDKVMPRVPSVTANMGKLFAGKLNPSLHTKFSGKPTAVVPTGKKSLSFPKISHTPGFQVEFTSKMAGQQNEGGSSSTKKWWAVRRRSSVAEKVTEKITVLKSNVRRRHRPSELFSAHFSFDASTLRTAGPTPQISPRTSMSGHRYLEPVPLREDHSTRLLCGGNDLPMRSSSRAKRQRRLSPKSSRIARYQSPQIQQHDQNNTVRTTCQEQPTWPFKANHTCVLSTDVHPGRQVDFSKPRMPQPNGNCVYSSLSPVRPRCGGDQRRHSAPSELLSTRRDATAPSRWAWFKQFQIQRTIRDRVLSHIDRAKHPYPAESISPKAPEVTAGPAMLLTPTRMTDAAAGTPETMSSSRLSKEPLCAMSGTDACCRPWPKRPARSISDPSMERFLIHVRASQEMRARMKEAARDNAVFVDESDKGFLSGEPL